MASVPSQSQLSPVDAAPAPVMPDVLSKKSNYFPWLLGILVLVVAITVFTFYQITKGNSKIQPTPLPSETSVKESDPTANWKTYANAGDKYTIKYPSIWTITENDFSTLWYFQKTKVLSIKFPNNYDESLERGDLFEKIANEIESDANNKALSKEWKQLINYSDYELLFKESRFVISSTGRTPYIFEFSNSLDRNTQDQVLSAFKFTKTNDAEIVVPDIIQQLIPQIKWGTQNTVSNYPVDLGKTISGLQRTGTIINPDVEGNPYVIDELLKDKNSLTNLGWSKAMPIGASGPFLSIATYYKTINRVNTRLEFHIENADYISATNQGDLSLVKCPCVNKITVFQQQ